MRVGFIGLGAMGLPMATNVLTAGYELYTTYHRNVEPARELEARGAVVLERPEQIAQEADVVITILPADGELKEVVLGSEGLIRGLTQGKVLIDMTSATPLTMREIEDALKPVGAAVIDAPVSGGTSAAEAGTLTIMVGADDALLGDYRPLLETMGKTIYHVGPVGQGKVVKMINQLMAAIHLLTIGEAFSLGVRLGADPAMLYRVIKDSSGYSRMMDLRLPGFLLENSFQPGFRLDLMKKDVGLALDSARSAGVPSILGSVAYQLFSLASAAGHGDDDFSVTAAFLADLARSPIKHGQGSHVA